MARRLSKKRKPASPPAPYLTHVQLEQKLKQLARTHPHHMKLTAIGKSHEGRAITLATLTHTKTGAPENKPAIWIDANIHATELAGSVAALATIEQLLTKQNKPLLDNATYYIVPRLNPDGAERALAASPEFLRSGTRPYPLDYKDDGLHVRDIDDNGMILQMRIEDPNGDWKISTQNKNLMEKRTPTDAPPSTKQKYYRLLPEGEIHNYDGFLIKRAKPEAALDFNRNYPFTWRPESEQVGAGPYPGSEPETRCMIDFIAKHPNINLGISFHTYSGAILRPYNDRSDDSFEVNDLKVYKKIGDLGSEITDYPNISVFHDFRYHPKDIIGGVSDDWMFHHYGIFAYTIEIWDIIAESGIPHPRKFIEWFQSHPHDHDVKIYNWAKKNAGPDAHHPWKKFNHPQLGEVEIGGWNSLYTFRNPPPKLMPKEAEKNAQYMVELAKLLPEISIAKLETEKLDGGETKIILGIQNNGFLPTYTSEIGKQRGVKPPTAILKLPKGAALVSGTERTLMGHLEGRSNKLDQSGFSIPFTPTDHRAKAEWVVRAKPGSKIHIRIECDRGGVVEAVVEV